MKIEDHFESFPVLETKRTILRPITPSDLNDIANYCTVPEVSQYTVWDVHKDIEDTKEFIKFVMNRYETQKVGPWGIELKDTGQLIGSCSFVSWDNNNRRAELGYVLSNQYWNQGLMSEVIDSVIAFGFIKLELIRIEARCLPGNLGSSRVMEKTGMKYEGLLRKHIWAKNDFQDLKLYSIIKDDFESERIESMNSTLNLQAVFIDRDGTIGGTGHFIHPNDFKLFKHAQDAINLLKDNGLKVFAFTNQHRISRGEATIGEFEHQFKSFGFDQSYICPHEQECECRKPKPGMLLEAAKEHNLDLKRCVVIGDVGSTDMLAAHTVGAKKILVKTGWGKDSLDKFRDKWIETEPDYIAEDILDAVHWLIMSKTKL